MLAKAPLRSARATRPTVAKRPARVAPVVRASLDPSIAIGGSTIAFLTLGRFVFLPYQRREAQFDDVGPKTTGNSFFDKLQQPASFTTQSNDPAGFGLVDVFGWGALGHAFGYFLLAASSLNDAGIAAFPR